MLISFLLLFIMSIEHMIKHYNDNDFLHKVQLNWNPPKLFNNTFQEISKSKKVSNIFP